MKNITLALLTVVVGAGSLVALSPNANAESRYEYCRHHRCNNYHYDRGHHYGYNHQETRRHYQRYNRRANVSHNEHRLHNY
jgi:hypothetical protein